MMKFKMNDLLIFFFISLNFIPGSLLIEFKSEEVDRIFHLLEDFGQATVNEINVGKKPEGKVNQYLTVTILSLSMLQQSQNWKEFPEQFTKSENRLKVFLNENMPDNWLQTFSKKPLHGEVRFLYTNFEIDRMLKAFTDVEKDERPFVFLYSYYIPCSSVKGVGYSCAEELQAKSLYQDDFTMIVAWNTEFGGTDIEKSKYFLKLGGIQMFLKQNNKFERVDIDQHGVTTNSDGILQIYFFSCLDRTFDKACVVDETKQNHAEEKTKIVSLYINTMFHSCTKDSQFAGKLTELSMKVLSQCMSNYIEENTGNDCGICQKKCSVRVLSFCARYSLAYSNILGRPQNIQNPYQPTWMSGPNAWKDLYLGYNENYERNLPAMYCFKKVNSKPSLCTIMDTNLNNLKQLWLTRKIPDNFP